MVERDLQDARVATISLDRRFATAYSGALQLAALVLAASGHRASARRGHHAVTLQALAEIMGEGTRSLAAYLDSCRSLRNQSDYDRAGVVSAADVAEIIEQTVRFRDQVLMWLGEVHPELPAGPGSDGAAGVRAAGRAPERPARRRNTFV